MFIELILAARRKSSRKRLTFFFVNYTGFLRYSRYCCTSLNNLKGKRDILRIKLRSKPREFEQTKTKRKREKQPKKPHTIPVNFTESLKNEETLQRKASPSKKEVYKNLRGIFLENFGSNFTYGAQNKIYFYSQHILQNA